MLIIREFEKKDQESAYKTWKNGMTVDWSQGLVSTFSDLFRIICSQFEYSVRCTELIILPFLFQLLLFFLGVFSTPKEGNTILVVVCLFWFGVLKGLSKYLGYSYVKKRQDMLDIKKNLGERFLVATTEEEPDNIIGTIGYVQSEEEKTFKVCQDNWKFAFLYRWSYPRNECNYRSLFREKFLVEKRGSSFP